jgi:hypothetical protein
MRITFVGSCKVLRHRGEIRGTAAPATMAVFRESLFKPRDCTRPVPSLRA